MGETARVDEDQERRRPGRPRDEGVDDAIMDAVVEILTEVGFRGLTIAAARARGVDPKGADDEAGHRFRTNAATDSD